MRKIITAIVLFGLAVLLSRSGLAADQTVNRIYVIHGYGASIEDHWFLALKHNLEHAHTKVILVPLPDSATPTHRAWQHALQQAIHNPDENSYFVAHSLGGISLLHYLAQVQPQRLGALILVSAFNQQLEALPQLDHFIDQASDFDLSRIKTIQIKHSHIFLSDADRYVSPTLSLNLAQQLGISYSIIQGAGHFLAEDGFSNFEQLNQLLRAIIDN